MCYHNYYSNNNYYCCYYFVFPLFFENLSVGEIRTLLLIAQKATSVMVKSKVYPDYMCIIVLTEQTAC